MGENMDRSLFFLFLSCLCIWLIIDAAVGKKHLANFLTVIFPFMSGGSSSGMTTEQVETAKENAPTSGAIGQDKSKSNPISGVPYGATRK